MGSLVGGWDSCGGKPPKGFEDFQEASPTGNPRLRLARKSASHTYDPARVHEPAAFRSQVYEPASSELTRQLSGGAPSPGGSGGPPCLARTSAPAVHGAHAVERYLARVSASTPRADSQPGSPFAPSSPRGTLVGSAPSRSAKFFAFGKAPEDPEEERRRKAWCERVESSVLNERPDEGSRDVWSHGSFKLLDPCHSMHYEKAAPVTPTADTVDAGRPEVWAEKASASPESSAQGTA
eukprot:scaffold13.g307.t1